MDVSLPAGQFADLAETVRITAGTNVPRFCPCSLALAAIRIEENC
ncbi:hypothetical protein RKD23_007104 [Streptomyces sp. SAI-170]